MKKYLGTALTAIIVLTMAILGFVFAGPNLTPLQQETLIILGIICGASACYCFVVGELARNNSQMDKLWSLLPIVYAWVIAGKGGMKPRLVLFAVIVTLWGIRLTINFARKGAYSIKFWTGEEDYRWAILRQKKAFQNRGVWALFDLFFISIYQNVLILLICLPALATMESNEPLGVIDYVAVFTSLGCLMIETAADEQQMSFYTTKKKLLAEGRALEDLPAPYNKGFNTTGLWGRARHPNYLGEQGLWICLYLFAIGAKATVYGVFHWTILGPMLLILLFLGSSSLGEAISSGKYPEYSLYVSHVSKYVPLWKYKPEKYQKD